MGIVPRKNENYQLFFECRCSIYFLLVVALNIRAETLLTQSKKLSKNVTFLLFLEIFRTNICSENFMIKERTEEIKTSCE